MKRSKAYIYSASKPSDDQIKRFCAFLKNKYGEKITPEWVESDMYPGGFRLEVGDDVIHFLAQNIKANVREIEGALTSLEAHSRLLGKRITLELTRNVMRDIVKIETREITVESIIDLTCATLKIDKSVLLSSKRTREVAQARQIAMYLCKQHTKTPLAGIGAALGGKNHATVLHACKTIPNLIETDKIIRQQVEEIERQLQ